MAYHSESAEYNENSGFEFEKQKIRKIRCALQCQNLEYVTESGLCKGASEIEFRHIQRQLRPSSDVELFMCRT